MNSNETQIVMLRRVLWLVSLSIQQNQDIVKRAIVKLEEMNALLDEEDISLEDLEFVRRTIEALQTVVALVQERLASAQVARAHFTASLNELERQQEDISETIRVH